MNDGFSLMNLAFMGIFVQRIFSLSCVFVQINRPTMNIFKWLSTIKIFKSSSTTTTKMFKLPEKIKIFESVQNNFELLGISSHRANQNHFLDVKFWMILLQFGVVLISYMCYIFYEAKTFEEYTSTMYSILTLLTTALHFLMHQWKMRNLFKFIVNFENFINKSEYKIRVQCIKIVHRKTLLMYCRTIKSTFKGNLRRVHSEIGKI